MPAASTGLDRKRCDLFLAAIPFVTARRKTTGGFGATPGLPATVEDTYHALRVLHLRPDEPKEAGEARLRANDLQRYLAGVHPGSGGSRTLFQWLWCCRAAGLDVAQDALAATVRGRMAGSDVLEDWYYGAGILAELLEKTLPARGASQCLAAVLNRGWRGVDEAWMHLRLSRHFRQPLVLSGPGLISWLQACQNGDGGFGFFPATTSFVENCHAALRALAFLGAEPLDPIGAFHFLRGCQTVSGGFGRCPKAAPFLDATWHALAALAFLK